MTQAFQDRLHERPQVTFKVMGEEFKGFVHEGEIRWFLPHPKQRLKDEHVEAIEREIHEKAAEQSKDHSRKVARGLPSYFSILFYSLTTEAIAKKDKLS